MAYDRGEQLASYRLRFEDHPGLTVQIRRPGLSGLLDIAEATPILRRAAQEGWAQLDPRHLRAWARLCGAFAAALVSWNLTVDGRPVPATKAGVLAQDFELLTDLVYAWQRAITDDATRAADADDGNDEAGGIDDEPEESGDDEPELDEEWLSQLPVVTNPAAPAAPADPPADEDEAHAEPVLQAVADA